MPESSSEVSSTASEIKKPFDCSDFISTEIWSLNVSNDLNMYKKIVPCGVKDKGITSLKDIGVRKYKNIDKVIINKFLNTFP